MDSSFFRPRAGVSTLAFIFGWKLSGSESRTRSFTSPGAVGLACIFDESREKSSFFFAAEILRVLRQAAPDFRPLLRPGGALGLMLAFRVRRLRIPCSS